jgi:hypothetical protein
MPLGLFLIGHRLSVGPARKEHARANFIAYSNKQEEQRNYQKHQVLRWAVGQDIFAENNEDAPCDYNRIHPARLSIRDVTFHGPGHVADHGLVTRSRYCSSGLIDHNLYLFSFQARARSTMELMNCCLLVMDGV